MNTELEQELFNTYPNLFKYHHEQNNDKLNPPVSHEIQCEDGWFDIINSACELISNENVNVHFTQIKEKFGGLRIYHDGLKGDTEDVYKVIGIIDFAKEISYNTCEICGNKGELIQTGWLRVRCEKCKEN